MIDDAVAVDILQHLPNVAGEVEAVAEAETVGEVAAEALEPQRKRRIVTKPRMYRKRCATSFFRGLNNRSFDTNGQ
eukprot:3846544-Amphidinium_carterae.2